MKCTDRHTEELQQPVTPPFTLLQDATAQTQEQRLQQPARQRRQHRQQQQQQRRRGSSSAQQTLLRPGIALGVPLQQGLPL
jgi:hypothetical protein